MRAKKTIKRLILGGSLVLSLLASGALTSSASAAPAWGFDTSSNTTVAPGGQIAYYVLARNVGDQETDGNQVRIDIDLPAGLSAVSAETVEGKGSPIFDCSSLVPGSSDPFSCTTSAFFSLPGFPGDSGAIKVLAEADPGAPGSLTTHFDISGGGALPVSLVDATRFGESPTEFGIDAFDIQVDADAAGDPSTAAAAHPYSASSQVMVNTANNPAFALKDEFAHGDVFPLEPLRDALVDLPPGLVGNTTGLTQCSAEELAGGTFAVPFCPASSQVGVIRLFFNGFPDATSTPLFNMIPPTGSPARFGFILSGTIVTLDAKLRSDSDYGLSISSTNVNQAFALARIDTTFWGDPTDPIHDPQRRCPGTNNNGCAAPPAPPLLRNPTSCPPPGQGLPWSLRMDSWDHPGVFDSESLISHAPPNFPYPPEERGAPIGNEECADVPVEGNLTAQPTSIDTETPSGLGVKVEVPNAGLENAEGISSSDIKGVKVTLPEGVTINPSQAEGLGVCSPAQYQSTELSFFPTPGKGCPDDSKIGTVLVHTPLLNEAILGDVVVAKPYDNPFNSLLAIYIVLHNPQRGILVKLAGRVDTDKRTGRIVTTFDDLPQLPFSDFEFNFRQGARAPLVTPPACGTYTTEAEFTPWSAADPDNPTPAEILHSNSTFQIVHGIGGGPCPAGGVPPFKPGFSAGALNNNAASYSPFNLRVTRQDGEQDMTRFGSVLPPGVLGKLAGVSQCPDAALAIAKAKTGTQELADPSCPANSQIGRTLVGAGVGSVLTYVPGKIYLGGPFNGDPLSVIVITPAVAGPFDVGTVITREALTLNPKTAEVEVDGAASDPIPHLLEGIPLKLRDLRVYVDRDHFTLNPTSCDPSAVKATLFGSYLDVLNPADDRPVSLSSRFQAANCSTLGFKPKLSLKLRGGTGRGAHPALTATYTPRAGDANLEGLLVRLPSSAFLDQSHIRTICTRVQFAAKSCPKGARYGFIKAFTPLLDEPLEGPVYLRSSNHKLPDLVFDLHGLVDVEVATRIDSAQGGIRASIKSAPDAPLSKVVLKMQGAKKGLIVNSRDLCASTNRATVNFSGQNGKARNVHPPLEPSCGKGKTKRQGHGGGNR